MLKVQGLDGREYSWKPENYHSQRENSSSLHKRARALVKKLYPFYSINEEVLLVGVPNKLYIDMYIHPLRMVIEVNGEQHYNSSSFFFSSPKDARESRKRDLTKREWCELNNLDLVELPYNETDQQWEMRIKNRGRENI